MSTLAIAQLFEISWSGCTAGPVSASLPPARLRGASISSNVSEISRPNGCMKVPNDSQLCNCDHPAAFSELLGPHALRSKFEGCYSNNLPLRRRGADDQAISHSNYHRNRHLFLSMRGPSKTRG